MADRPAEEEQAQSGLSRRDFLKYTGALGVVLGVGGVSGLAAACGTSSSSGPTTTPTTSAPPTNVQANQLGQIGPSLVSTLPADIQGNYDLATTTPLGESIYKDFKPKAGPPWLIGFASSYSGNSWRIAALNRLTGYLMPRYKSAGLIKDVIITQSNNVLTTQIQQIRSLVQQGCHAIYTIAPAPTGLNGVIKYCYDNGVLFTAQQGAALTPYAFLVSGNYALAGKLQATSLGKTIGGKGNVLIIQGITQAQASQDFQRGHETGLAQYPGIKVAGIVAGQWTDSIAKTQVLQFLSTHPAPLAGIASQSPGDLGAMEALQQLGKTIVPITAGGEYGPIVYWRDNPTWISEVYQSWPPGSEMQEGWEGMMRVLEQQGPKIATVMRGPSPITYKDLATVLPANATLTSNGWIDVAPGEWFPTATMDQFFNTPHDPLTWRPA